MLGQRQREDLETAHSPPAARWLVGSRQILAKATLLVFGLVVALLLGEITVRIFATITHRVQLVVSDERAGWALLPNLRNLTRGGEGGRFVINTDSEGHRLTSRAVEPVSPNHPAILVVGDSFVQSTGVDDDQTFPWLLASEMPVNVINLGVLGYGTDQELISLDAYLQAHPTLNVSDVVVLVCTNDFMDVQTDFHYLARTKPRFQLVDGRLVRPVLRLGISDHVMDVSYLYWLVYSKYAEYLYKGPNEPSLGVDLVVACVDAMRESVGRRGAQLHVLAHHLKELQPLGESRWADFCRRAAQWISRNACVRRMARIPFVTMATTGAWKCKGAPPICSRNGWVHALSHSMATRRWNCGTASLRRRRTAESRYLAHFPLAAARGETPPVAEKGQTLSIATPPDSATATASSKSRRWLTRRGFLKASGGLALAAGAGATGYFSTRDRIRLGVIGCGIRGSTLAEIAKLSGYYLWRYGSVVALADVNRTRAEVARAKFCPGADVYQDYRHILGRDDVNAVIVATPDHWHAAITMEALRAGKAIFHEKPFTHTIAESQALIAAVRAARLPFLAGTHQRNMWACRLGAELVRNGRLGKVPKAHVVLLNKGWRGGPFHAQPVPAGLDWDRWLGPAPVAAYCRERYEKFHGWWDYGGGEMMNWGAHHVDLAMWAMSLGHTAPIRVTGTAELPSIPGGYEIPADFSARLDFPSGETIEIRTAAASAHTSGVLFEGETSSLWVDREKVEGPAFDELRTRPLPPDAIHLHNGAAVKTLPTVRHLSHFYDVVRGLSPPISDAETAHTTNVALHLANIAIRVGRPIRWDQSAEVIVNDPEASALLSAPRRAGYELVGQQRLDSV